MKPLIYVAGPYSAATIDQVNANVRKAEEVGQVVLGMGLLPIIPHKISSHWDHWGIHTDKSHGWWIDQFCLPLLSRCDAALFIDDWQDSKGAVLEHKYCLNNKIMRYYSLRELEDLCPQIPTR